MRIFPYLLVSIGTFIFFFMFNYVISQSQIKVSNNILTLTQPVMAISGNISKIENDSLWVTKDKTVTYKIILGEGTKTTSLQDEPPYLFKPHKRKTIINSVVRATSDMFSLNDLINVATKKIDLRTYQKDSFEADYIYSFPSLNNFNGVIIKIEENILTIKGIIPAKTGALPEETDFTLKTAEFKVIGTPDTEISKMDYSDPSKPSPVKLNIKDLKKDESISVYTKEDIYKNKKVIALLIQPFSAQPISPYSTVPDTDLPPAPPLPPPPPLGLSSSSPNPDK